MKAFIGIFSYGCFLRFEEFACGAKVLIGKGLSWSFLLSGAMVLFRLSYDVKNSFKSIQITLGHLSFVASLA